ncbi:hypothetical protein WJX73_005547 [Symbiochloris irregularis]|uniref:Uncharacterized protein n=1 Tax=Symbiochloris irregularis TaxID=706552 RepID=A0AAW1NXJ2_9CHLO
MHRMMDDMLHDPFVTGGGFHSQWPPQPLLQGSAPSRAAITIEEVEGEPHQAYHMGTPSPRVEEPGEGLAQSARVQRQHTQPPPAARQSSRPAPRRAASGSTSYYSSSSSFSQAGGSNGVVYSSSSSSRMGPGGVMEHSETVQDGRTGESSVLVSRFLGDRGRTITRMRGRDGQETGDDNLHNLREDEANAFHQDWTAQSAAVAMAEQQMCGRQAQATSSNNAGINSEAKYLSGPAA